MEIFVGWRRGVKAKLVVFFAMMLVCVSVSPDAVLANPLIEIPSTQLTQLATAVAPSLAWSPDSSRILVSDPWLISPPVHGVWVWNVTNGEIIKVSNSGALASWRSDHALRFLDEEGAQAFDLTEGSAVSSTLPDSAKIFRALAFSQCHQRRGVLTIHTNGDENNLRVLGKDYPLSVRYMPWFEARGDGNEGPVTPPCLSPNGEGAVALSFSVAYSTGVDEAELSYHPLPDALKPSNLAVRPDAKEHRRLLKLFFGDEAPDLANFSITTQDADKEETWVLTQALNTGREQFAWLARVRETKTKGNGDYSCHERKNVPGRYLCEEDTIFIVEVKIDLLANNPDWGQRDVFSFQEIPGPLKHKNAQVMIRRVMANDSREGADTYYTDSVSKLYDSHLTSVLSVNEHDGGGSGGKANETTVTFGEVNGREEAFVIYEETTDLPGGAGDSIYLDYTQTTYSVVETPMRWDEDRAVQEGPSVECAFTETLVDKPFGPPKQRLEVDARQFCMLACKLAKDFECAAIDYNGGDCDLFESPLPSLVSPVNEGDEGGDPDPNAKIYLVSKDYNQQ